MNILTPSELLAGLETILYAGLVPNIIGSPGTGKSDIIKTFAREHNLKLIDIRLSQIDPVDLSGFLVPNEERTKGSYIPIDLFPLEDDELPENYFGWLIFLDEMNSAHRSVQAASYKLVLDRMIGNTKLHSKVAIVCAGNLATDNAIVTDLSTAMQSRLVHLELETPLLEWVKWASNNGIADSVIGFVQHRPELLHNFQPDHSDHTFPCHRTWEFVSKIEQSPVKASSLELLKKIISGTVGPGAAVEYLAFKEYYKEIPSSQEILTNPGGTAVPSSNGMLYALSTMFYSFTTVDNAYKVMEYISRMPIEFQIVSMRSIQNKNLDILTAPSVKEWIRQYGKELYS